MAGAMTAWLAETWERRAAVSPQGSAPRIVSAFDDNQSLLGRAAAAVTPLMVACSVLAVIPDFDVFFHTHRTYSHSLGAAGIVWILTALVAWRLRLPVVKVATICAAAYGSHVLLDWLGRDDSANGGLMVLWPFNADYYRSGLNLFLEIDGHPRALLKYPGRGLLWMVLLNRQPLVREVLIIGPLFLLALKLRLKRWARKESREPKPLRRQGSPGIARRFPLNPDVQSLRTRD